MNYSLYKIIRLIFLALVAVYVIVDILELANGLGNGLDVVAVVQLIVSLVVVVLLGAYGSYKHNAAYLLTFALIGLVCLVVGLFANSILYSAQGITIVLMVLAVLQAELIRRGTNSI